MKIVVTGNPNYEGLCKGIYKTFGPDVEFIGRWNGWDVTDLDAVADYVKDFDVFVNSQYGPNGEQIQLLEKVYPIFKGDHIVNISSTTSWWDKVWDTTKPMDLIEGFPEDDQARYFQNKMNLDIMARKLSKNVCWGTNKIRISNIAFGQLASKYKVQKNHVNKISLTQAASIVKWVIDSPTNMNVHYIAVDPIQREGTIQDNTQEH